MRHISANLRLFLVASETVRSRVEAACRPEARTQSSRATDYLPDRLSRVFKPLYRHRTDRTMAYRNL